MLYGSDFSSVSWKEKKTQVRLQICQDNLSVVLFLKHVRQSSSS